MRRKIYLKEPRIALVSFYSHLNLLLPLVKILEDGGWECYFFVLHRGSFLLTDPSIKKKKIKSFCRFLEKNEIKAIGFSLISLLFLRSLRHIVKILRKKFPEIIIACGGPAVTSSPKDFIEIADIVWIGPIDKRFPKILRKVFVDKKKRIIIGKDEMELDKLYDVKLLEIMYRKSGRNSKYFLLKDRYGVNLGQRCFWECSYCIESFYKKNKYYSLNRIRSVDNVVEEMYWAKKKFGQVKIFLYSNCFPSKNWIRKFCKKYKEKVNLPFFIPSHPIQLDLKVIRKLRKSGLRQLAIGIETTNKGVCEEIFDRKHIDENILFKKLERILNLGVRVSVDLMIDNPYLSDKDYEKDFNFLFRCIGKKIIPRVFCLVLFPNYPLTVRALEEGKVDKKRVLESKFEPIALAGRFHFYSRDYLWPLLFFLLTTRFSRKFLIVRRYVRWMKEHRNFFRPIAKYLYKFLLLIKLSLERLNTKIGFEGI